MTLLLFFAVWFLFSAIAIVHCLISDPNNEVTTEEQMQSPVGRYRAAVDAELAPPAFVIGECPDHGRTQIRNGRCHHGCDLDFRTLLPAAKVKRRNRKMKLVAGGAR